MTKFLTYARIPCPGIFCIGTKKGLIKGLEAGSLKNQQFRRVEIVIIPQRIKQYLELLAKMGTYLGDAEKGEIEIIIDPAAIVKIEAARKIELENFNVGGFFGEIPPWQCGILLMDPWFAFVRDPVKFPDGTYGLYDRLFYINKLIKEEGCVTIAPIDVSCGKLIMKVCFRHSERGYFAEIPGVILQPGESLKDGISRCVYSDLGAESFTDIFFLGHRVAEKGIAGERTPIFAVLIPGIEHIDRAKANQTTVGYICLSREEYLAVRRKGEVMHKGYRCAMMDAEADAAVNLATSAGIMR